MKKLVIRKFKNGKKATFQKWCDDLMTVRKNEAIKTLRQENLLGESAFVITIDNEDYCVLLEDVCEDGRNMTDKNIPINKEHLSMLYNCLEFGTDGEMLYDLRS